MEDHTKPKESPKYRVIGTRPIRHDGVDKFTDVPSMVLTMLSVE